MAIVEPFIWGQCRSTIGTPPPSSAEITSQVAALPLPRDACSPKGVIGKRPRHSGGGTLADTVRWAAGRFIPSHLSRLLVSVVEVQQV
jgi:hypothetical protein